MVASLLFRLLELGYLLLLATPILVGLPRISGYACNGWVTYLTWLRLLAMGFLQGMAAPSATGLPVLRGFAFITWVTYLTRLQPS